METAELEELKSGLMINSANG